jgi:hypothetical protein
MPILVPPVTPILSVPRHNIRPDRHSNSTIPVTPSLHVGVFTGTAGTFRQRTELSQQHKTILSQLNIAEPPRVLHAQPATH